MKNGCLTKCLIVVDTVKTLKPALPHSQTILLHHFIGLRYIHLSVNGISEMGAWFLDYYESTTTPYVMIIENEAVTIIYEYND